MTITCSECRHIWREAEHNAKAQALDDYASNCGCEKFSLSDPPGDPVDDAELIVRILTMPDADDTTVGEILARRFTALFSSGVSMIREGASDAEIYFTVNELTKNPSKFQRLIGFVILPACLVRDPNPTCRDFCVYDTPDGQKRQHADILCPPPRASSGNQNKKIENQRRHALKKIIRTACQNRYYY